MSERLILKWGTLKGWADLGPESSQILLRYCQAGSVNQSAMLQRDTPGQRQILCELIDSIDGEIWNDWENAAMTKEAAKAYVLNYNIPGR